MKETVISVSTELMWSEWYGMLPAKSIQIFDCSLYKKECVDWLIEVDPWKRELEA